MNGMMWLSIAGLLLTTLTGVLVLVRRVACLETKLDNGLTLKISVVESRQHVIAERVAEMHGWMQATHGPGRVDRHSDV